MKAWVDGKLMHVCVEEDPWDESKGVGLHPDMVDMEGDLYCPHCGVEAYDAVKIKDVD